MYAAMALAWCKTKCLSVAQRCGGTIQMLSCTEAAIVAPRGAENSRDDAMPALNRHTRFDGSTMEPLSTPSVATAGGPRRGAARQLPDGRPPATRRLQRRKRTTKLRGAAPRRRPRAPPFHTNAERSRPLASSASSQASEPGQPHPKSSHSREERVTSHHVALGSYRTVRLRVEDVTGETEEEAGRARQTLARE